MERIRIYSARDGYVIEVRGPRGTQVFCTATHSEAWVTALKYSAQYGYNIEAIYGQTPDGLMDSNQGQEWDRRRVN